MHRLSIYNGPDYVRGELVKARPMPGNSHFPYEVKVDGQWLPAIFDSYGNLAINLATIPQPEKAAAHKPRPAPASPKAHEVTYEAWKAGKIGHGPKVTAPRGMGEEWEARLYCENAVARAKRYAYNDNSEKQYHTGSYNDRRRQTMKSAHRQAWEEGIKMAKAVMAADGPMVFWTAKKELVREALAYSSYLLSIAG